MAVDALGRPLRDLRISVTDRCNFRCTYCMPKEVFGRDFAFLDRAELLTFEEIARLARSSCATASRRSASPAASRCCAATSSGSWRCSRASSGVQDIALTTNGSLLTREKARALRDAGLNRITISLDSLDDAMFRRDERRRLPGRARARGDRRRRGGRTRRRSRSTCVVKRGVNDEQLVDMARRFRGTGHIVRFIEYMDVGNTNGWRMDDVVPGARDRRAIAAHGRSSRSSRTTSAKSPSAGATPTAPARSASSPRSRSRSAAAARARASPPTASSISASSPAPATTCAPSSAAAPTTKRSPPRSARRWRHPRRPLLGNPLRGDAGDEGGDVAHRRLTEQGCRFTRSRGARSSEPALRVPAPPREHLAPRAEWRLARHSRHERSSRLATDAALSRARRRAASGRTTPDCRSPPSRSMANRRISHSMKRCADLQLRRRRHPVRERIAGVERMERKRVPEQRQRLDVADRSPHHRRARLGRHARGEIGFAVAAIRAEDVRPFASRRRRASPSRSRTGCRSAVRRDDYTASPTSSSRGPMASSSSR